LHLARERSHRALRVYENYGLIMPGRSAAGWRRYGAEDLLKLNEIGLLKVLGLTLKQIRDLTRRPSPPSLRQLLELQLGTWKHRRAEAERGLAVAQSALKQLQSEPGVCTDCANASVILADCWTVLWCDRLH
jgi:DNA-binding transcriptional MerR regulator